MIQSTTRTIFLAAAILFSSTSQATLWNVTGVLQGSDSGFGFSSLHAATEASPMSGTGLGKIDTASGTYNDVTGKVNFTLGISTSAQDFTLTGTNFLFDGSGDLADNSELAFANMDVNGGGSGFLGFRENLNCCGGTNGPNSFTAEVGGLQYMTLWGANYKYSSILGDFDGSYEGASVGMDMRMTLSAVPVPAAVWLFGTALIGLAGFSKRKKAV